MRTPLRQPVARFARTLNEPLCDAGAFGEHERQVFAAREERTRVQVQEVSGLRNGVVLAAMGAAHQCRVVGPHERRVEMDRARDRDRHRFGKTQPQPQPMDALADSSRRGVAVLFGIEAVAERSDAHAIAAGEHQQACELAHRAAGAASMVGAEGIAEALVMLERSLREPDNPGAPSGLLDAVEQRARSLGSALDSMREAQGPTL